MSLIKREDATKWINAFIALGAILVGFVMIKFMNQLSDWFDLEAKWKFYLAFTQAMGVISGLAAFLFAKKHKTTSSYLDEVYNELVKIVWPDGESTTKVTIGILVGLIVISGIMVFVDFIFKTVLDLIY